MANAVHARTGSASRSLADYWPLIALTLVTLGAGAAIGAGADGSWMAAMHGFMGVFLVVFALLKLFDLNGFRRGFAMYDLAARRVPAWGLVYPFVELALGLAFLAHFAPTATYVTTIAVFSFGAAGVVAALRRGLNINCPCMGNILAVPLSTVTLTEDLAMVGMAAVMLTI